MIRDLTSNSDPTSLDSEASSWTISDEVCPGCSRSISLSTSCYAPATQILFGGPDILGPAENSTEGQYFELQFSLGANNFDNLAFSFQFWVVSLEPILPLNVNDIVDFSINGGDFGYSGSNYYSSGCLVNYTTNNDTTVINATVYSLGIEHLFPFNSTSTVAFRITSKLNVPSATTSFGLRNFYIALMNTPHNGTINFPCDIYYYWDDITCSLCHEFCSSCSGPTNNQCSACVYPNYNYGNGTCSPYCPTTGPLDASTSSPTSNYCRFKCGDGFYWTYNDSCTSTCDSPLVSTHGTNWINYCASPCPPEYVYPNGTCTSQCSGFWEPVIEVTNIVQYCKNPCETSGFMYPDGTCDGTCPSPLLSRTEPDMVFCFTPCQPGVYLYPNSSCYAGCSLPLLQYTDDRNFLYCKNPCNSTAFLYPDSSCNNTCAFPLLSRTEPDVKYCFTPCGTNEYLYPNGSCYTVCEKPLVQMEEPEKNFKFCTNPCDPHGATPYLYPNSTCYSTCPSPLLSRSEPDVVYCYTPCRSNKYLYVNESCSERCDTPLLKKEEPNTFKFCINPCQPADSLFLFPDSSCDSVCPLPLFNRSEPDVKYCYNPCAANNTFLSEIQTCQKTCPAPSIFKNGTYAKYCYFPCQNYDDYYNMMDEKCEATCDYPYKVTESPLPKLCSSSLTEEERKQVQQMASATDTADSASNTANLIWSLISSGDSTAAMMGPLNKMLQYIKWMDIMLPEKVQLMLLEQTAKANKKGFAQKMMGSALDNFPNHALTGNFLVYPINSSFFVNFWPSLFNLSAILVVTLLVVVLTTSTKGNAKITGILKSVSEVLKWNMFLVQFCGSIGDIVLFSALELQTVQFENAEEVISFILCLGINTLAVIVVVKILDVNSAIRRAIKDNPGEEHQKTIEQQWRSYKALFECYKDYSFYQQIFLFVFIMRLVLFNAAIGYLYKYPLFQASITMTTNLLMFGYLVIKRPMKKVVPLIQQIVLELVLLPFNACVLILAIMDSKGLLEADRRKAIGNVIFQINVMVPFLSLVLMAAKFIAMGVDLYKTWRLSKLKKPALVVNKVKLRNQPMSLETSGNKSFTMTDNNNSTTQILDMTDHSMYPEMNMMRLNSRIESPINSRIRSPKFFLKRK